MPPQTPEQQQNEFKKLLDRHLSGETLTDSDAQTLYNYCFNACEVIPTRYKVDTYELY